jgi:tRNA(adenine34) deaminase
MDRALAIAEVGLARGEMPIGAVVVVDGEVVGEAHTEEQTQQRLLVHADLLALDRADRALKGRRARAALYVNLEPCVMCLGAAFTMKVGTVVFGLESPTDGGVAAFEQWDRSRDAAGMPSYRVPTIRGGVRRRETAAQLGRYAESGAVEWARQWAADLAALVDDDAE